MGQKKLKFVIIDGNAIVHRAFHALPPLTTKQGQLVNAVYGFTSILLKVISELKPDYLAMTYDLPGPTFRDEMYEEYKATRQKQPDELYQQIPLTEEVVRAFRIPIYTKKGYEADDVIGTLCKHQQVDLPHLETIIVTGDMDTLQLVDHNTKVYSMKRGVNDMILYDEAGVAERFNGLKPAQVIDFKALRGDPSDNIPGVKGIGEKGAIDLIKSFGSLENLYQQLKAGKVSQIKERLQKLLTEQEKQARLSKKLATIVIDVPLSFELKDAQLQPFDEKAVYDIFSRYQFKSLLNRLPKTRPAEAQSTLFFQESGSGSNQTSNPLYKNYHLVQSAADITDFLKKLEKVKAFAIDTETDRLSAIDSRLLGMSFSWKAGEGYYLDYPALHQLPEQEKKLASILSDQKIKKHGHNIKYDYNVLRNHGLSLAGLAFDSMLAAYLLNPGSRSYSLDQQAFSEFGHRMIPIEDLIGKGKNQISMADVPVPKVAVYAAEDADFTWRLAQKLAAELPKKGVQFVFDKIELPLVPVLADMELAGIEFDVTRVKTIAKKLKAKIKNRTEKIYAIAGDQFNINSPLQLKEVLFEKLKISTDNLRKTKTGISTAARELEKMRGKHEIIDLISEYREYTKLLNTYVEALPQLVNKKTGRIHTSFNQTIAATGRLSSADPNLQNIPIRTEEGQAIRGCFRAATGYTLLSLDYSQIELRIAAALSRDTNMMAIFEKGEDFHVATASEIYGVSLDKVSKSMRSAAKAVNFGVMYGMGAYGLSQGTGISHEEARAFIERYYSVFAQLKEYLETIKALAHKQGYVETLFGRRRYIPEIASGLAQVRSSAERVAINTPIQGTEADLVKMAMIALHPLIKGKKEIRMLLQVHDELVFEIKKGQEKSWVKKLREIMEQVHDLGVPIVVDAKAGSNWEDMKSI